MLLKKPDFITPDITPGTSPEGIDDPFHDQIQFTGDQDAVVPNDDTSLSVTTLLVSHPIRQFAPDPRKIFGARSSGIQVFLTAFMTEVSFRYQPCQPLFSPTPLEKKRQLKLNS